MDDNSAGEGRDCAGRRWGCLCVCMQDDDYGNAVMRGLGRGDYVRHTHQVHHARAWSWCKHRMQMAIGGGSVKNEQGRALSHANEVGV